MKHDLVGVILLVALVALAPVVAYGVCKDAAAGVECGGNDASSDSRVSLEPVLGVLVPEMEGAVATGSAESAMLRVERDVVDRVDVCDVALRWVAMALEGEIASSILLFHVLDSTTSLDTADSKARGIGEATDNTGLPLERALQSLIEFERIRQVDDVDVSVGGSHHKKVVADIHRVDALLGGDRAHWRGGSQVPVLDRLVPRTCHDHGAVRLWRLEEARALDGLVMGGDLGLLGRGHVAEHGLLVCAGRDELRSILSKAR